MYVNEYTEIAVKHQRELKNRFITPTKMEFTASFISADSWGNIHVYVEELETMAVLESGKLKLKLKGTLSFPRSVLRISGVRNNGRTIKNQETKG